MPKQDQWGQWEMFIDDALNLVYTYSKKAGSKNETKKLCDELLEIADRKNFEFSEVPAAGLTYSVIQSMLSKLNEKESIRKSKGVYYTPSDVVRFILSNSAKALFGKLRPENISDENVSEISRIAFCTKKTVFDPTCGAGEFLLAALELKFDLLSQGHNRPSAQTIKKVVATICGNDINEESVVIAKLRLLLCVLHRFGIGKCAGLAGVMRGNFHSYDYVTQIPDGNAKYSVIVGNPPYVEDAKSGLAPMIRYGNVYANVLVNASAQLEKNGSMGFIIPISYISTLRMKSLRDALFAKVPEQYVLSYADRPDCLFDSVHQKLCILIGKEKKAPRRIYTGNYQFWYKKERDGLFLRTKVTRNPFYLNECIPKLGTPDDIAIFKKVTDRANTKSVYSESRKGSESVYLNRRETFWMKAFRTKIEDPEYKVFHFSSAAEADYCYCLIHSSLFWWYWISVSDCWHVSKELNGFRAPFGGEYGFASLLAADLLKRLEETRVFVGTAQTDYEYKHKECIREIHAIDDYINALFGLTDEQSRYIKEFAYKYRMSGGADSQ